MNSIANPAENQLNDKVRAWFERFVHDLRTDQMMLETNVASEQKQAFYHKLANGSSTDIAIISRVQSSMYFIEQLIKAYINELQERQVMPLKLGVDLSDAKVLAWVEINDDDEATEDQLRLAEAKVNAQFMQYGFHLTSTIVETADRMAIPSHYQSLLA